MLSDNEMNDLSVYDDSPLAQLIFDLTSRYDKKIRPVRDFQKPIIANISLKPYQLLDVVIFCILSFLPHDLVFQV